MMTTLIRSVMLIMFVIIPVRITLRFLLTLQL